MYFVYVLYSGEDRKFYIGYTENLNRRLSEHKSGNVYSTSRIKNPILVYYEAYISCEDARRREQYFKTSKGKRTLKLMLRDTLLP
ncbi:MAG: GIY-YIG nuclease family protein [Candidatus Omnitrophica bacterium]|nr:GIY-YIG nuclease family protein [Candidatus Omnitrophota bacterium]